MTNKYVLCGGLAFSADKDMKKLKVYAQKGWFLEDMAFGMFYRLKKGKPDNTEFAVDYQSKPGDEYFNIFSEAGWTHLFSLSNEIHFFSAAEGSKAIYTDRTSELERDSLQKERFKRWLIMTSLLFVVTSVLHLFIFSKVTSTYLSVALLIAWFVIGLLPFIFTLLPYLGYSYRVRKLSRLV